MNGRLISVSSDDDSSCFAFSAASFRRWRASLSFRRSTSCSFWKLSARLSMMQRSKSSPPRCVSPLVDLTLKTPLANLEDRDVERAPAEVVDGDPLGVLLLEPVGERGRRRLVDDALHVEPGDLARVLRGLALRVVEVRGDRDDGLGHRLAQVRLGDLAHLRRGRSRSPRAATCRARRRCTQASPFGASKILYGAVCGLALRPRRARTSAP